MEGKLMKSKAFIFSVTALYFVMLFVLFMGLINYTFHRPVYKQTTSVIDKMATKYVSGDINVNPEVSNKWCVRRIVYDANKPDKSQSPREIKIYCEHFAKAIIYKSYLIYFLL